MNKFEQSGYTHRPLIYSCAEDKHVLEASLFTFRCCEFSLPSPGSDVARTVEHPIELCADVSGFPAAAAA